MKKSCITCKAEFETNYQKKITCSDLCRIERKNEVNKIHSKEYYKRKKQSNFKSNDFLRMKLS